MAQAAVTHPGIAATESDAASTFRSTFPDLVWAHHRWEKSRREGGRGDHSLEVAFRRTLEEFEREYGTLVSVYWSRHDASAVGVTIKEPPRWRRLLGMTDAQIRFHRATDWVTSAVPAIPDALNACETLAAKVSEVLRSTSERVAMQWIFSVASHLLGFVERTGAAEHGREAHLVADEARAELHEIESYYDRAGMKAGRIVYAAGMVFGIGGLIVLGFVSAAVLWAFGAYTQHGTEIQVFFACYAAGALGGIVSVMSRMASPRNAFVVDYEVGRASLRLLGSFRPLLGAIFGLSFYFAVKGQLLQITPARGAGTSFYWYTALAFVAGFSERFTKVLLDSAEGAFPAGRAASRAPRHRPAPAAHADDTRAPEHGAR
jgi:hypothetical protein